MTCSMCGLKFDREDAAKGCAGCPMSKGCELVKCPRCGFELAPEPEWALKLKRRLSSLGTKR